LPEDLGFADQHRVEAGANPEEMPDGLMTQQRIEIRFDVVTGRAVTKVGEKRLDLRDTALVVVELGVDFDATARLQHHGLLHRFVIAERDQRFGHAR
jgi:hypothetical protein